MLNPFIPLTCITGTEVRDFWGELQVSLFRIVCKELILVEKYIVKEIAFPILCYDAGVNRHVWSWHCIDAKIDHVYCIVRLLLFFTQERHFFVVNV